MQAFVMNRTMLSHLVGLGPTLRDVSRSTARNAAAARFPCCPKPRIRLTFGPRGDVLPGGGQGTTDAR